MCYFIIVSFLYYLYNSQSAFMSQTEDKLATSKDDYSMTKDLKKAYMIIVKSGSKNMD